MIYQWRHANDGLDFVNLYFQDVNNAPVLTSQVLYLNLIDASVLNYQIIYLDLNDAPVLRSKVLYLDLHDAPVLSPKATAGVKEDLRLQADVDFEC